MTDNRTYSNRAEYLKRAVALRRKAIKVKALAYMGYNCIYCGYNKYDGALEFHHRNPSTKQFGIAHKGITRS